MSSEECVIQRLAVKARLTIRFFEGWKEDKGVTNKIINDFNTKTGVVSVRKAIISHEKLKVLKGIRSQARQYHRDMTLPWGDSGERILNANNVQEYKTKMRNFKQDFDLEVQKFKVEYPDIIINEMQNLGLIYKSSDYPDVNTINDKFEFISVITPVESADDFRVSLSESVLDEIKNNIVNQEKVNNAKMVEDVYNRLYKTISGMVERLSKKKINPDTNEEMYGIFRNTTIENVKQLVKILPSLNLMNDAGLTELGEKIKAEIGDINAEDIRANMLVRDNVVTVGKDALSKIETAMEGIYDILC